MGGPLVPRLGTLAGLALAGHVALAQSSPPAQPAVRVPPAQESTTSTRVTLPGLSVERSTTRSGGAVTSETMRSRTGSGVNGPNSTETRRCGGGSSVAPGGPVADCPVVGESIETRANLSLEAERGGNGVSGSLDLSVGRETRYSPDKPTFEAQQAGRSRPGNPPAMRRDVDSVRGEASVDASVRGVDANIASGSRGVAIESTTGASAGVVVPPPSTTHTQGGSLPWGSTSTRVERRDGQPATVTTTDETGNRASGTYASSTRECRGEECQTIADERGLRLRGSVGGGGGQGPKMSVEGGASVSMRTEYSTSGEGYEARYERRLQQLREDARRTGEEGHLGANDGRAPYRVDTYDARVDVDVKANATPRVKVDLLGGGVGYSSSHTHVADEDALRMFDAGMPARNLERAQQRTNFERLKRANESAEHERQARERERAAAAASVPVRSSAPDASAQLLQGINAAAQTYVQQRASSARPPPPAGPSGPSSRGAGWTDQAPSGTGGGCGCNGRPNCACTAN